MRRTGTHPRPARPNPNFPTTNPLEQKSNMAAMDSKYKELLGASKRARAPSARPIPAATGDAVVPPPRRTLSTSYTFSKARPPTAPSKVVESSDDDGLSKEDLRARARKLLVKSARCRRTTGKVRQEIVTDARAAARGVMADREMQVGTSRGSRSRSSSGGGSGGGRSIRSSSAAASLWSRRANKLPADTDPEGEAVQKIGHMQRRETARRDALKEAAAQKQMETLEQERNEKQKQQKDLEDQAENARKTIEKEMSARRKAQKKAKAEREVRQPCHHHHQHHFGPSALSQLLCHPTRAVWPALIGAHADWCPIFVPRPAAVPPRPVPASTSPTSSTRPRRMPRGRLGPRSGPRPSPNPRGNGRSPRAGQSRSWSEGGSSKMPRPPLPLPRTRRRNPKPRSNGCLRRWHSKSWRRRSWWQSPTSNGSRGPPVLTPR